MVGFLSPEEVLKQLKLREDMTAADFGCGSGGWVIPLAKRLENGTVYAIDILEEPLSVLKSKAKLEKIYNVEIIQADIEGKNTSKLSDSSCDLVLMTNLLFQCENRKSVLEEGKRVLKTGGKILAVDWNKDNALTKAVENLSAQEVKKIAKYLNLKLEKEFKAGLYHWGLVLVK